VLQPDCGAATSGPQLDPSGTLNVGVAAHIHAAAEGGPRYLPEMLPEERSSPENGLWLCQTHAKLVDNDEARFTAELLRGWKQKAEEVAFHAIGKTKGTTKTSSRERKFGAI
jgi:hypothetical protein